MKQPTHILNNSASCINLIFTSQPNLVMHSGANPSLHAILHHQVIFAKFHFTIFYPYNMSYKRLIWHYQQANTNLIKQAIELIDWKKVFLISTLINKYLF